jgi:hypothetical protein
VLVFTDFQRWVHITDFIINVYSEFKFMSLSSRLEGEGNVLRENHRSTSGESNPVTLRKELNTLATLFCTLNS